MNYDEFKGIYRKYFQNLNKLCIKLGNVGDLPEYGSNSSEFEEIKQNLGNLGNFRKNGTIRGITRNIKQLCKLRKNFKN